MNTDDIIDTIKDSDIVKADGDDGSGSADLEMVADEESDFGALQKKIRALRNELAECGKKERDYLEGWQRSRAEHVNYKNDEVRRSEEMQERITSRIISDFLPVLDSFELGFSREDVGPEWARGIDLIKNQLEGVLKKYGLREISTAVGDAFNPAEHESMGEVMSDSPAGAVAGVLQKGYAVKDRVIRPARVTLSKGLNK